MLFRRLKALVTNAVKGFFDDACTQRAAAISYYVLFSIFPLVIFTVGILGLFLQDEELQTRVVDAIMDNMPLTQDEGRSDVADALSNVAQTRSGAIGSIGLIGLAWSSSAIFGVVRSALNTIYRVSTPRPIVMQKLIDLGIVLLFAPFFILSVTATSFLRFAERTSEDLLFLNDLTEAMGWGWWVATALLPIIFSFMAFFIIYWIVPARRMRPLYIVPGALLAALLFELVKLGFNIYLENFARYDVVFGSLGAVVAFLFWVFISANIFLMGAELISALPEVMSGKHDTPGPKAPKQPLARRLLMLLRGLILHPEQPERPRPPTQEELTRQEAGDEGFEPEVDGGGDDGTESQEELTRQFAGGETHRAEDVGDGRAGSEDAHQAERAPPGG